MSVSLAAEDPAAQGGVPVIATLVLPDVGNLQGGVFGGWIMAQLDLAAGLAGRRQFGLCVTKSVQTMVFHRPLRVGDGFRVHGRVAHEGRTSFRLLLEGWREPGDGLSECVVSAEFTMVCTNYEGRPQPLRETLV